MTPRISKAVAKVLDELWPYTKKDFIAAGGFTKHETWRESFRALDPVRRVIWISAAKWHLKQLADKSKEGK